MHGVQAIQTWIMHAASGVMHLLKLSCWISASCVATCLSCRHAAGSCVCNEANLSGEAMPIQKRQCPLENMGYEVDGRGARHTLFSSTAVLQAGNSNTDQVLAVVSATGMHCPHLQVLPGRWQASMCSMTICVASRACLPKTVPQQHYRTCWQLANQT